MAARLGFKCTKSKRSKQAVKYSPYFSRTSDSDTVVQQSVPNSGSVKKKREPGQKYGGKTEDEVMEMLLPDRLGDNLDILFVGINPGLMSAYKGHHYCSTTNHFWPCLIQAGLVPGDFTYLDDWKCPLHGIGLTNIVERTSRSSSDLSRREIKEGKDALVEKIKRCNPLITCFNGKGIYEIFCGKKSTIGRQQDTIPDTNSVVYVMPSSSARTITFPRKEDKYCFYMELKKLRDDLKLTKPVTVE